MLRFWERIIRWIQRGWKTIIQAFTHKTLSEIPLSVRRKARYPLITDQAFYGKAAYREYLRSKLFVPNLAHMTSTVIRSADERTMYRVYSDGSYRKVITVRGRKIAIA